MMRKWRKHTFERIEDLAEICNMTKHKFCQGIKNSKWITTLTNTTVLLGIILKVFS